jgi:hypothetical protein
MHIDRVDFTDAKQCGFCERPLRLGIAHIVRLDNETEMAAGPVCAKKNARTEGYPDFTRAGQYTEDQVECGDNQNSKDRMKDDRAKRRADTKRLRAIEYLRLRQERMSDFPQVRYAPLVPVYERFCRDGLNEDDIAHLNRLIAVVERRYPLFSLQALQTAYAYHKLILSAANKIESAEKRQYLFSLDDYLRVNLRLTAAQIDGANRWLEHLGHVRLRHCKAWQNALPSVEAGLRPPRPIEDPLPGRNTSREPEDRLSNHPRLRDQ